MVNLQILCWQARNYDVLCYHLKVVYKSLNTVVKQKLDDLIQALEEDLLLEPESVKQAIEDNLPRIFDLRLAALRWMASEDLNSIKLLNGEAYSYFESLSHDKKLAALAENILFALRCNNKVIGSLIGSHPTANQLNEDLRSHIPDISLDQFAASIILSYPDERVTNLLIEWAKCSLRIEYVGLIATLVSDKGLKVSNEVIRELSFVVIDAAQTYSAIAIETGMVPSEPKRNFTYPDAEEDADFLAEQKALADAGLNYFAKIWKA